MHEFPCNLDENHFTTGDALPPHRFLAHRPPCPPQCMYSFTPHLPEQLSSAIQPGPATLGNGIQCPLREKILLRPSVSSKTSTGNITDGGLEGTPQLFRVPQSTHTHKSPLSLFANSSATLSSQSLPTSSLGWDGTILLDLSCNLRVATTLRWSDLRN